MRGEAEGVENLAFQGEETGAVADVGGFGEVVGCRIVGGLARCWGGESRAGREQVGVNVGDAAHGAGRGGDFGC